MERDQDSIAQQRKETRQVLVVKPVYHDQREEKRQLIVVKPVHHDHQQVVTPQIHHQMPLEDQKENEKCQTNTRIMI